MDPKVSGVFENKTEEGSTQEKWGAQLQVASLHFPEMLLASFESFPQAKLL